MAGFDVVGFGALNVDKLFKVDRIAKAEEESFVQSIHETCGGSAANTIVGLARLGCNVGFIGKVGNDHESHLLLDEFVGEHVNPQGITRVEGNSGAVMGFVDKQGARALYINSGVNDKITLKDLKPTYLADAKYIHLTSFVGKTSFETQKKLLEKLPNGIRVSFDPGALYAQKTYKVLAPIIEKTYVMMPNALELQAITKQKTPEKGAQFLLDKGVKNRSRQNGCRRLLRNRRQRSPSHSCPESTCGGHDWGGGRFLRRLPLWAPEQPLSVGLWENWELYRVPLCDADGGADGAALP